jgi:two-component sensor histidine kinase
LAEAHSLLSQSEWSPIRLGYLASRIIHAVLNTLPPDQQVQVEISSATVEVSPRQASNLALVLNELATNTLKHTLAGRYPVRITVQIAVEDGDTIFCQYRDDGPGYPDKVLRLEQHGVGIYLINRIVTMTLQGQLTLANEGGAVTTIRFATEERNST